MCHGKVKNEGLRSKLERESGGLCSSGSDCSVGTDRIWLARRKPWGAARMLRVRVLDCSCSKPAMRGNERLERNDILKMMVSGKAKNVKLKW